MDCCGYHNKVHSIKKNTSCILNSGWIAFVGSFVIDAMKCVYILIYIVVHISVVYPVFSKILFFNTIHLQQTLNWCAAYNTVYNEIGKIGGCLYRILRHDW